VLPALVMGSDPSLGSIKGTCASSRRNTVVVAARSAGIFAVSCWADPDEILVIETVFMSVNFGCRKASKIARVVFAAPLSVSAEFRNSRSKTGTNDLLRTPVDTAARPIPSRFNRRESGRILFTFRNIRY